MRTIAVTVSTHLDFDDTDADSHTAIKRALEEKIKGL